MNGNPDKSHLLPPQSFQELIRGRTLERKEHVRGKRQDGLRRITEMKSKIGVNPLTLFPKEIWLTIMHKLYPEDRGSIHQIHPMFQDLMKDNHIQTVLLPQALHLVLDHVKNNDTHVYYMGHDISKSELLPFIKLREVSKTLRFTVDRWFQQKIEEELHEHENPVKPSPWNPVSHMVFHLSLNLNRLNGLYENYLMAPTDKAGRGHRSPPPSSKAFFLRSIEVKMSQECLYNTGFGIDEDTNFNYVNMQRYVRVNLLLPFRLALFKFLGLVGHQILSFKLNLKNADEFGVGIQDHYYFLQQCCFLMPNLRKLQIHFHAGGGSYYVPKKDQRDLCKFIGKYPFPTLRKLERVDFTQNMNVSVTPKIYDAILKANPQVKIMKFVGEDEYLGAMPHLKTLKLKSFSWKNIAFLGSPFPQSHDHDFDLIQKNWPLKVMELHPKFLSLNFVFRALKAFPTLEKLKLVITPDEMKDNKLEKNIGYLHLPNLTHFDCSFSGRLDYDRDDVNFFFSLQFLFYAKKLKWLRWTYLGHVTFYGCGRNRDDADALQGYLESQECPERMIDFRSGRRDLKDSNVWKVFPHLEMVEVVNGRNINDEWIVKRHYRPT